MNIFALGQGQDLALVIVAIDFQPRGRVLMAGEILCRLQNRQLEAAFADGNFFANAHLVGGNVDLAACLLYTSRCV